MKIKQFDLLLSCAEDVLRHFKDEGDHYVYTGSMNNVDRLRELISEARMAYDDDRLKKER